MEQLMDNETTHRTIAVIRNTICGTWHGRGQLGCSCILDKNHNGPHCCQNGARY